MAASSNPFRVGSWGWGMLIVETTMLEEKTAHYGGDFCVLVFS